MRTMVLLALCGLSGCSFFEIFEVDRARSDDDDDDNDDDDDDDIAGDDDDDDDVGPASDPCGGDCDFSSELVDVYDDGIFFYVYQQGTPSLDAALAADGTAHVALYDPGAHELRYVTSDGWAASVLWTTDAQWADVSDVAIEVDSDEVVHLAWGLDEYRYARTTSAGWFEDNLSPIIGYPTVSLALDPSSDPIVSCDEAIYRWDGVDWEDLVEAPETPLDLVVDSAGTLHAMWVGGALQHGWYGSAWSSEEVISGAPVNNELSMALGDGVPHVFFSWSSDGWSNFELLHAENKGGVWSIETLDTIGETRAVSAVIDAWGRPHIAYTDVGLDAIVYAWRSEDGWVTDTVATGRYSEQIVLRLDPSSGNPVLFVMDAISQTVLMLTGS